MADREKRAKKVQREKNWSSFEEDENSSYSDSASVKSLKGQRDGNL